jgi:ABC-2 type transport system permease protein
VNPTLTNILTIARREFTVRARTRSYRAGTVVVVIGVLLFAFLPVLGQVIQGGEQKTIALYVGATDLTHDPQATFTALLNASPAQASGTAPAVTYKIVPVSDVSTARDGVTKGTYSGALAITRGADGDLDFTYFTKDETSVSESLTSALVQQAAQSYAVADRLARLGIEPGQQAGLFAPVAYDVQAADASHAGKFGTNFLLGFGLSILVFMTIILYGSWIAMSVVEEKSSRVVEVVLNAATPFQLLAGKVIGVGGLALLQYLAIIAAALVAFIAQVPITNALVGGSTAGVGIPEGLTPGLLILLGIYGVLGFALYSVLFAAAGSLASRQEDVNQVVMPMTLLATAGYLVAIWSNIGVIDAKSPVVSLLAIFPFFSPFMMLSRFAGGDASLIDVVLSVTLLSLTILGALWLAARIYSAGVLLYGQRPSVGRIWRVIRTGA